MWRPVDVDGGHRDDTLVTFTHKPAPDPLAKYGDDEETLNSLPKEEWDAADKWLELARGEMANLLDGYEARGVWRLVETLRKAGYNPDEDEPAELWLYARAGETAATL